LLRSVGVIAYEIRTLSSPLPPAVIHFLHAEGKGAAKIHRPSCRIYGDNVMSDSCVREWCRKFRDGRTDVHVEDGQGRHSIVTDEVTTNGPTPWLAQKFSLQFL
jgi:hypothetical protein